MKTHALRHGQQGRSGGARMMLRTDAGGCKMRGRGVAEVPYGEVARHCAGRGAVDVFEGKVAYQTGVGAVKTLVAAFGNGLGIKRGAPDAHVVNATG